MPPSTEIVFVYNADGSVAGKVKDFLHKIVRPSTYDCQLCAVTYGFAGMKSEWRNFVASVDASVAFLHRDELGLDHLGIIGSPFPGAWRRFDGEPWEVLLDAPTLRACERLDDLIGVLQVRLGTAAGPTIDPSNGQR
jgi:hypothetical protein